jgi:hypothetical protein
MTLLWGGVAFLLLGMLALALWRQSDRRSEQAAASALLRAAPPDRVFDASMLEGLPSAAQRYFRYTIAPGAVLRSAVKIEMRGELGLGAKHKPNYRPMRASQLLVPPFGLIWRLQAGDISGSDGATPETSWTRFWLFNLLPVVRASGDDHRRSAFGRVVAEASFWSPASLLPSDHVRWEQVDDATARAVVLWGAFEQAVDIKLDADGRPVMVVIQRWSNENQERRFQLQPFGGYLSAFAEHDGYRLPMQVEGGNWIGTRDYFPFYRIRVDSIRMLETAALSDVSLRLDADTRATERI